MVCLEFGTDRLVDINRYCPAAMNDSVKFYNLFI